MSQLKLSLVNIFRGCHPPKAKSNHRPTQSTKVTRQNGPDRGNVSTRHYKPYRLCGHDGTTTQGRDSGTQSTPLKSSSLKVSMVQFYWMPLHHKTSCLSCSKGTSISLVPTLTPDHIPTSTFTLPTLAAWVRPR